LQKDVAETVARHLVAAGMLVDDDPATALAHARYARRRASRIAVVREAAGIAAYHAGEWAEALAELRAARRMGGGAGHLAVMADVERAMGRPERAIELSRGPEARELPRSVQIELAIVVAGARRDLDELDAAVVALQLPELEASRRDPWSARLFYAYADNLLAAGRESDALQWFVHAADADDDGQTDADVRIADLTGEPLADDGIEFALEEDAEATPDDPPADGVTDDAADHPVDHADVSVIDNAVDGMTADPFDHVADTVAENAVDHAAAVGDSDVTDNAVDHTAGVTDEAAAHRADHTVDHPADDAPDIAADSAGDVVDSDATDSAADDDGDAPGLPAPTSGPGGASVAGRDVPASPTNGSAPRAAPAPLDPVPSDPVPSDPAPSDLAPSDSAQSEHAPSGSAPSNPVHSDPAPPESAPSDPASSDSAPSDPAPSDPPPSDPAPVSAQSGADPGE
jgi:hypothetical protein